MSKRRQRRQNAKRAIAKLASAEKAADDALVVAQHLAQRLKHATDREREAVSNFLRSILENFKGEVLLDEELRKMAVKNKLTEAQALIVSREIKRTAQNTLAVSVKIPMDDVRVRRIYIEIPPIYQCVDIPT